MELSHSQHVCWRLNQPMRALLPEGTWRQPSGVHWFLKGSCEFLQQVMDATTSTTLTGSRQRRGQRSEVRGRGAAEVINVMNTPESEGRGHSEEHSGLPPSASPSRVLPSRLINYWESQPESSVCVCVCVCLHHACSLFTRVLLPRQHRLWSWRRVCLIERTDASVSPLFKPPSSRLSLLVLHVIDSYIDFKFDRVNLLCQLWFLSLILLLLLSLTPAFIFSFHESRSRPSCCDRSIEQLIEKESQTNRFQSLWKLWWAFSSAMS